MASEDLEKLVFDDESYPRKRRKARQNKDLGRLNELLTRGLPTYCDADGVLDVKGNLAQALGVSYQAVYGMFKRESISRKRVEQVVHLSEQTRAADRPGGWLPLNRDDFWEFLAR